MTGIQFNEELGREGMKEGPKPDLPVTIQEASRSSLSEWKTFDIMGEQAVKKIHPVRSPDRQESAGERFP